MRNNSCFLDTSAFVALNHANDQNHTEARDIAATLTDKELVTSDAVVNETYNILGYLMGFEKADYFLQTVLAGPPFIIADVTKPIRVNAVKCLEQYREYKTSYCNALSAAIMKEQQIQKIFAFDRFFEVIGLQHARL